VKCCIATTDRLAIMSGICSSCPSSDRALSPTCKCTLFL